jgi:tRNA threonylcarbamoyladenosine biosynthesis protein TsaB
VPKAPPKALNILAIDCATEILSAALACNVELGGAAPLRASSICIDAARSELLFTIVDSLLTTACVKIEDIDLFVCQRGPGSWTGLRIGFSAVKGFALALHKPYISIPTLDCAAHSAALSGFDGVVLPVLDAKQQRFFCALYENGERTTDYLDASPEAIAALIPEGRDIWLTGDAAEMILPRLRDLPEKAGGGKKILDPHFRRGRAEDLLKYLYKNPTMIEKEESSSSAPLYLRKSDAEINCV